MKYAAMSNVHKLTIRNLFLQFKAFNQKKFRPLCAPVCPWHSIENVRIYGLDTVYSNGRGNQLSIDCNYSLNLTYRHLKLISTESSGVKYLENGFGP